MGIRLRWNVVQIGQRSIGTQQSSAAVLCVFGTKAYAIHFGNKSLKGVRSRASKRNRSQQREVTSDAFNNVSNLPLSHSPCKTINLGLLGRLLKTSWISRPTLSVAYIETYTNDPPFGLEKKQRSCRPATKSALKA